MENHIVSEIKLAHCAPVKLDDQTTSAQIAADTRSTSVECLTSTV
jgi:hypothetical protein